MYTCEKSSPPSHELSYIGLFNFFHLNLFCVNAINFCKKINFKNSHGFFFFFETPIMNGPIAQIKMFDNSLNIEVRHTVM